MGTHTRIRGEWGTRAPAEAHGSSSAGLAQVRHGSQRLHRSQRAQGGLWAEGGLGWVPVSGTSLLGQLGMGTASKTLSSQGFLSDLLKKANRPYDEPKLQEYTQTIVSDPGHCVPTRDLSTPGGWHAGEEVMVTGHCLCPNSCGCST